MRPFTKLSSYLFFLVIHHHIETLTAEPLALIPSTQISYHGTTINSIEHFLNIKYAHDTSGLRRFAPPLLFVPPQGTHIDASTAGPACPQTRAAMPPAFTETPDISEDCLHLRIARPQGTMPSDKLPVVIWLHGGGVVKGSGYDPHFDPTNLLTLSRDLDMPVIYVALNYRLTIFGFARTPLLKDQQSLNVGVRDQRVAMQWVKDNIAHFGGDPDRITVYGLSAGGTFASLHLVSYGGETGVPFNRVWSMSGPLGTPLNMSSSVTEMHTSAVARDVGCNQDGDAEVLACLRDVPMEELLDAAMEYSVANQPPAGLFTFIPSVDGDMFPERQSVLYKAGRFVKGIPMVLGWTQDDGAMNAGPALLFQDKESMKPAIRRFTSWLDESDFAALFELYSVANFEDKVRDYNAVKEEADPVVPVHYFRISQILRDVLFTCSSIDFGYEMSKQSGDVGENTRLYVLNQSMMAPLWKGAGMPYISVSHGSDTHYIFNGLFPEGQIFESDQALSRKMAETFIRFAATGDPNGPHINDEEHWPAAFTHATKESEPRNVLLQIVGGPYGTATARISTKDDNFIGRAEYDASNLGDSQQRLQGYELGGMTSKSSQFRNEILAREKLLERCAFINSLAEKLGI